jgi:glutaconate CoA-transferase subunit B
MPQTRRAFVERVDFVTSLGHGPTGRERRALGVRTAGPALIVTDLCMMKPDPDTKEFEVVSLHPGVTPDAVRDHTGWPMRFAATVDTTPPPDAVELDTLRDLQARTARAHAATAGAAPPRGRRGRA